MLIVGALQAYFRIPSQSAPSFPSADTVTVRVGFSYIYFNFFMAVCDAIFPVSASSTKGQNRLFQL